MTRHLIWLLLLAPFVTACKGQDASAERTLHTDTKVKTLVAKTVENMRRIEGGSFWLGDFGVLMTEAAKVSNTPPGPDAKPGMGLPFTADEDNKPPRWVTLDTFYLGAYKVTYEDFDVYTNANGLPPHPPTSQEHSWQRTWKKMRTGDDVPAGVHWDQAKAYCLWLGKMTGLPFDLPTEAQWEYAASNGKNDRRRPYPTASGFIEPNKTHPTFGEKKKLLSTSRVYPVGRFSPSPNGLYDLVGNGFDWVDDWYAPDGYQSGPSKNPKGPTSGHQKVLRGYPSNEDFVDFIHLTRLHEDPSKATFGGEPNVYGAESFRCAINQVFVDRASDQAK
jgi:formylglycine-generating enzyme